MKNVITDLGLNPDGTTDNLAALNVAIAAFVITDGAWFWPAGTYRLSATPSVIPNSSVWYGEGMTLTSIKGTRAAPSSTATLSVSGRSNVTFRDLHVTTTDDVNAAQQCIDATGSTNFTCRDVKVSNAISAGIRAASKAVAMRYFGGECTNVYQDNSASCFSGDFSYSFIQGTYFHDNATQNTNTRHCIYINGAANPTNITIANCVFKDYGGGNAIEFNGNASGNVGGLGYNYLVKGCSFSSTLGNNAITASDVNGCSIVGNTVYNVSGFSLVGNSLTNFLVANNTCTNGTAENGITFITVTGGGYGGRITGNVYSKAFGLYDASCGIRVQGITEGLEIDNNTFSGISVGVLLTGHAAGNTVNDVDIYDNRFSNQAGSVSVITNGRYVVQPSGLTAGVAVDGIVSNIRIKNNKVANMQYEIVFTTNTPATGSNGQADSVSFTSNAGAVIGYLNGALPTNHPLQRVEAIPL